MGINIPNIGAPNTTMPPTGLTPEVLQLASSGILAQWMASPTLAPEEKQKIIEELARRKAEESHAASGPEDSHDEDSIEELLKKLRNGTISPAELAKLAQMLGVSPADLQSAYAGGTTGVPDSGDIH